jgi:hypothetical protein
MTPRPISPTDPLACAAGEALRAARWESAELLSRRPPRLAADLLRGHAAELATSPLGGDQVLSLALETAARNIELGSAPMDEAGVFLGAEEGDVAEARERLRMLVLQPSPASSSVDVVDQLERRLADRLLTAAELAERLTAEASLQEALWDDPRIPAAIPVRLAMRQSIPRLRRRASELADEAPPARRNTARGAAHARPPAAGLQRRAGVPVSSLSRRGSSKQMAWVVMVGMLVIALVATAVPLDAIGADLAWGEI